MLPDPETLADSVCTHPLPSVTVKVYVPEPTPLISGVLAPLSQLYVYGPTPPVTVEVTPPLNASAHDWFVGFNVIAIGGGGASITHTFL